VYQRDSLTISCGRILEISKHDALNIDMDLISTMMVILNVGVSLQIWERLLQVRDKLPIKSWPFIALIGTTWVILPFCLLSRNRNIWPWPLPDWPTAAFFI